MAKSNNQRFTKHYTEICVFVRPDLKMPFSKRHFKLMLEWFTLHNYITVFNDVCWFYLYGRTSQNDSRHVISVSRNADL